AAAQPEQQPPVWQRQPKPKAVAEKMPVEFQQILKTEDTVVVDKDKVAVAAEQPGQVPFTTPAAPAEAPTKVQEQPKKPIWERKKKEKLQAEQPQPQVEIARVEVQQKPGETRFMTPEVPSVETAAAMQAGE